MSIEEVKGGIARAVGSVGDAAGGIQQGIAEYENARNSLQQATEGSGQSDASEAINLLNQAIASANEAFRSGEAGKQAAEAVAARL